MRNFNIIHTYININKLEEIKIQLYSSSSSIDSEMNNSGVGFWDASRDWKKQLGCRENTHKTHTIKPEATRSLVNNP